LLVERPVACGAAKQEPFRVVESFRPFVGVVVLHLMIVPGNQRRHLGMQTLQIWIEPIPCIAIAVGRQRRRHDAIGVAAYDRPLLLDDFVNIVSEKHYEFGMS
jgi:hypothetical protein